MKKHHGDLATLMDNPAVLMRSTPMGGMACSYMAIKAGTDMAPAFKGLADDACPCPHWGYVLTGALRVRYMDGREEVVRGGELYYLPPGPPGHTAVFEEDSTVVEFSPQREYDELLAHLGLQARA